MKNLIILLMSALLMIVTANGVLATTVYIESSFDGKMDNSQAKWDYDLSYLGADIPIGNWKIGLEYFTGEWEWALYALDVTGFSVKIGYNMIQTDNMDIYINLGFYQHNFDSPLEESSYNQNLMFGFDMCYALSERFFLGLSYDTYLDGKYENDNLLNEVDVKMLQTYKIRLTYCFNEKLGLSVSYRSVIQQPDALGYFRLSSANWTLGLCYSF